MKKFFKKKNKKKPAVAIDRRRRMRSLTDVVEKNFLLSFFLILKKWVWRKTKDNNKKKRKEVRRRFLPATCSDRVTRDTVHRLLLGFFFTEFYRVSLGCDGRRLAFAEEKSVSAHWNSVKLGNSFWPWSYLIFFVVIRVEPVLTGFWLSKLNQHRYILITTQWSQVKLGKTR